MLRTGGVSRNGFTLVEVMMASVILVVGFIGLIQAVTIGSETLDTARKQQVATQIMDAEIESLRTEDWATIANFAATGSITIDNAGVISGDETRFALSNYTTTNGDDNLGMCGVAHGFTCSYTRTRLRPASATASNVTYIKFVYTVSWTSNTGRAYSRSTETYLGANGLHLSFQKS